MSDLPPVSVPAAGVNLLQRIQLITAIDKTPHDELQISTSMVINNLTPVSGVPFIGGNVNVCTKFIIDQTSHDRQVSALAPTLAVASVAQQAQQSMSGAFANARNVLVTGGTFVRLCSSYD